MRKARSVLIMPAGEPNKKLKDTVADALREIDVEVMRPDDMAETGAALAYEVIYAIRRSDFVVVDITKADPNVFYELGYAHAMRKPEILLMSSESESGLPRHLIGSLYIVYDPDDLHDLPGKIKWLARSYTEKVAQSA